MCAASRNSHTLSAQRWQKIKFSLLSAVCAWHIIPSGLTIAARPPYWVGYAIICSAKPDLCISTAFDTSCADSNVTSLLINKVTESIELTLQTWTYCVTYWCHFLFIALLIFARVIISHVPVVFVNLCYVCVNVIVVKCGPRDTKVILCWQVLTGVLSM